MMELLSGKLGQQKNAPSARQVPFVGFLRNKQEHKACQLGCFCLCRRGILSII